MKRRRRAALDLGVADPVMELNDKLGGYRFAEAHGVDHPRILGEHATPSEIDWDALPGEFVVKSRTGSSGRGVWALRRTSDGSMTDLLTGLRLGVDDLIRIHADGLGRRVRRSGIIVEELVPRDGGDGIADDWKFYCFGGRVELSMQRRTHGQIDQDRWRFRFRDRDGVDLGPVKFPDRHDPALDDPRDLQALTATAERISSAIGRPFVRVDLFESERGPLFGELTPEPGPPEAFDADTDRRLGAAWERAETEIHVDQIGHGRWDHLRVNDRPT